MKRTLAALSLCVLVASACSPTKTDVRSVTEPTEPVRRVVVLPFNDERVPTEVRDKAYYGSTREPEAGARVSDAFASALVRQDVYEVLHGRELAVESRRRGIHIDELHELPPKEVAEHMNADAVVVGEVYAMSQGWVLLVSVAQVRFRARCIDARTGGRIWEAEGRGRNWFNMEYDHAVAASDRIAERLAQGDLGSGLLPLP